MSGNKISTLIIEDSGLMRIMLSEALREDPDIAVLGTANNGKEGVEKALELNPDVVITDMVMPNYNGLYVVKELMRTNPKPIFLLSSLHKTNDDIFDALQAGALDFIDKPSANGNKSFERSVSQLLNKIKTVGVNATSFSKGISYTNQHQHTFNSNLMYDLVVIGASTGGPATLETIIAQLPENFPVPIVIAQHMPDRFIKSYCERLDKQFKLKITMASNNQILQSDTIYLAPGTQNLEVKKANGQQYKFAYTERNYKEFNNPSVDCLFTSAAKAAGSKIIGAILTGMGKDGVDGLGDIRREGGVTIAQDAESCIVNGMPGAARIAKAVDYTVKLNDIAGFIVSCIS